MALPGWLFLFIIPVCGSEMGQKGTFAPSALKSEQEQRHHRPLVVGED